MTPRESGSKPTSEPPKEGLKQRMRESLDEWLERGDIPFGDLKTRLMNDVDKAIKEIEKLNYIEVIDLLGKGVVVAVSKKDVIKVLDSRRKVKE